MPIEATLGKMFEFLEVDASEHYLEVCADKVYKSTSWTRELMFWPPSIKHMVEEKMKRYEFLSIILYHRNSVKKCSVVYICDPLLFTYPLPIIEHKMSESWALNRVHLI